MPSGKRTAIQGRSRTSAGGQRVTGPVIGGDRRDGRGARLARWIRERVLPGRIRRAARHGSPGLDIPATTPGIALSDPGNPAGMAGPAKPAIVFQMVTDDRLRLAADPAGHLDPYIAPNRAPILAALCDQRLASRGRPRLGGARAAERRATFLLLAPRLTARDRAHEAARGADDGDILVGRPGILAARHGDQATSVRVPVTV